MIEPIPVRNNLVLDGEAVYDPNGNYRIENQQNWEKDLTKMGKRLPTVGEYIITFNQLMNEQNIPALNKILEEIYFNMLCAGKINFSKSNFPEVDNRHELPTNYLDNLVKDPTWRKSLEEELFHYDAQQALDIMQRASGRKPYLWLPNIRERRERPKKAIWLSFNEDRFNIVCVSGLTGIQYGAARGIEASITN